LSVGDEFFVTTGFDRLSKGAAVAAAALEDTATSCSISCTNKLYNKRPGMANCFCSNPLRYWQSPILAHFYKSLVYELNRAKFIPEKDCLFSVA
jgi:hypothetical protein